MDAVHGTEWIPLILRVHQKLPERSVRAHDRCYVMSAKKKKKKKKKRVAFPAMPSTYGI